MSIGNEKTEVESVSHRQGRRILEGLKRQKDNSLFTDVTVVIDKTQFSCHRVILAASSEFFRASFCSNMKEHLEGRVSLEDISCQIFSEILECIYSGKNILNDQDIFEIWHAANQLQILFLIRECELFLRGKISLKNCFNIYQNSKLLDSKDLMQFSWSYILENFESVRRSEDILMFSADELRSLVSSEDLNARTEDDVIETILLWVAYSVPETEYEDKSSGLQKEPMSTSETSNQQAEKLRKFEHGEQQETNVDQKDDSSEQSQHNKAVGTVASLTRSDHLVDLLRVSRICLISSNFLFSLMKNEHIRNNQAAQKLLEEASAYQLQPDRRHDYCPSSAIHRLCSNFESVVVGVMKINNFNILVCRKQNGKFYHLMDAASVSFCAVCFNDNVYISIQNQQIFAYVTLTKAWCALPLLTLAAEAMFILAVGNFLYVIHKDNTIEMLNLVDTLYTSNCGKWVNAGSLSDMDINIYCATVIQDKIVFFGSNNAKNEIKISVFDTTTKQCQQLHDGLPISSSAVSFSNGKESFILQNNGALYRLKHCPDFPFIEVKYQTMLWAFERELRAAVLFNDELLLFGPKFSENVSDNQWELGVEGVFKCVRNIPYSDTCSSFMHTVVPKMYATNEIAI